MEEYDTTYHRRKERKFLRGYVCCEMLHSLVLPPVPRRAVIQRGTTTAGPRNPFGLGMPFQ
jgi:hypothetical protein